MNVHLEFSERSAVARVYRVAQDVPLRDRSDRPKLIALTFDDGPYPMFTPMLLDVLRDERVPATFFLIGKDASSGPRLRGASRRKAMRSPITRIRIRISIKSRMRPCGPRYCEGRDVLWNLTHDPGVRTLMRPPHGRYTERTLQVAQSLGYSVVLWTDDSGDWRSLTADRDRTPSAGARDRAGDRAAAQRKARDDRSDADRHRALRARRIPLRYRQRTAPSRQHDRTQPPAAPFGVAEDHHPRQIIDVESSRPAYVRRRITTFIVTLVIFWCLRSRSGGRQLAPLR